MQVGEKLYSLTLLRVRPTVFRCDCGKEVRGRSVTHITDGRHKSCGCLSKGARKPRFPKMKVVKTINPETKCIYQKVLVKCGSCGQESVMRRQSVGERRYGCAKCWKQQKFNIR